MTCQVNNNFGVIILEYKNELSQETSPYLLQHAHNPVNWFPWGEAAFNKARKEDKPIFLSIGYSTCHWCHVMAHESFEDITVAEKLNESFISIKVDREERPDIDGVYMRACQAMTGSGGWPTSIFMSADGNPFFAGTYFPKDAFLQLLQGIVELWKSDKDTLLQSGEQLSQKIANMNKNVQTTAKASSDLITEAVSLFSRSFDGEYGGFGGAPKFPSPHNLMFLLDTAPHMAEKTLESMYRGGIFDHIGGGFSRYSTDRYWLVPHFEKMLYDNALLAMAYLLGYEKTGKKLYHVVVERIFQYLERELLAPDGGFYSAQDADSEGVEGKFYLFTPAELVQLLGETDGNRFCQRYGITDRGNFEGKSIANLLHSSGADDEVDALIPKVYEYRKLRIPPHTDKKKLTSWNALATAAYAMAGRILKSEEYLTKACQAINFIERELAEGVDLFVGVTDGRRQGKGFLDDYAFVIFALMQMHQASLDDVYLDRAAELMNRSLDLFWDEEDGGFFFSGRENEKLISRPKESWDAAMPSGNSVMAYNLSRLSLLTENERFMDCEHEQRSFMNGEASSYPMGYGFYLFSSLPVKKIICVPEAPSELLIRSDWVFRITNSSEYPLINGKTTYYVCENGICHPPTNEL